MKSGLKILALTLSVVSGIISIVAGRVSDKILDETVAAKVAEALKNQKTEG